MHDGRRIQVSLVYAGPDDVFHADLDLPLGSVVQDAIDQSGLRDAVPGAEIRPDRIGVFARRVAPDRRLRDGDRVEIYRPLKVDPKNARRRRAERSVRK